MRSGIREFQPRQPLDRQLGASTLNQILRELESLRITRVVNGTFRKLPGGTEITVAPQRGGGSTSPITRKPWDIYVTETEGEGENIDYTLKVQPGTLARVLPTNWDDEFTAEGDTLYYGIATVQTDGTYVTGVTIKIEDEPPAPQAAVKFGLATSIDVGFGLFKAGTSKNFTDGKNIDVATRNVAITLATPTIPGNPAFDMWFRLQ